jgi:hypothetical protein
MNTKAGHILHEEIPATKNQPKRKMNDKVNVYLARKPQYQDKLRKYKVVLDDVQIDEIKQDQTLKLEVSAGEHTLVLKVDWTSSNKLLFNAKLGEDIYLECGNNVGANPIKMFLGITFVRNSYLYLKRSQ